jgi:hypothetical protein
MLRHLQNLNELVIYASISCGLAFIARLFPAFYFPILLLRIGVLGYCLYVVAGAEGNRELAITLGGAMFLGMIGGNWDWLEVYLRFNQRVVGQYLSIITFTLLAVLGLTLYLKNNGKTSQK